MWTGLHSCFTSSGTSENPHWEKSFKCDICGRTSPRDQHLTVIVWFTLERNHTNVRSVGSVSLAAQICISTRGSTQERSLINVRSVVNASFNLHNFRPIGEFTRERNHMYVKCVVRASFTVQVFKPIRESTQERKYTDVMSVGRTSG